MKRKKDNPILFNERLVVALLNGSKTQTRRVRSVLSLPLESTCRFDTKRLWVRETFAKGEKPTQYYYRADSLSSKPYGLEWKPSIHMPRDASRLTLTNVKVSSERLQDISESDAKAEGARPHWETNSYVDEFMGLWDSLYAGTDFCWDNNPSVWVVSFSVRKINIDQFGKHKKEKEGAL